MQTKLVFPLWFVLTNEPAEPMWETITTTDAEGNVTTEVLDFTYDASGSPYSLSYNGTTYYYVVNLQGDVMRLVSANGATVAEYWYGPYGELLTATGTMAEINSLRYRGYYYDAESEFYYLQSRYYDPTICRFINADVYASTGQGFVGYNMFAYCGGNPVNRIDSAGEAWWHWAIGAVVVVGFGILTVATCGGSLAVAATSVGLVANGIAATTTATTVAASAFIGSTITYGVVALSAASSSDSVQEFCEQGNWGVVGVTACSGFINAASAYFYLRNAPRSLPANTTYNLNGSKDGDYVSNRGWSNDMITYAINNGRQGTSVNMANGAPCTVYCYPGMDNQYVVIENVSRSIVQVSNFYDSGWIPDSRIVWIP